MTSILIPRFSIFYRFYGFYPADPFLIPACVLLVTFEAPNNSMQVDLTLMQHLANLSRLEFSEKEMTAMQSDMQAMIGFVEQLNGLDTSGVEPLRHMSDPGNIFRADNPAVPVAASSALSPAQNHDDQFFKVPKVIS